MCSSTTRRTWCRLTCRASHATCSTASCTSTSATLAARPRARSLAGTPNSTAALQEQGEKIKDAVSRAYRKSGEVALVVVALAAIAWGFFVCRARRRSAAAGGGYKGLFSSDPDDDDDHHGGDAFRANGRVAKHRRENGDLEAAAFDENELDDLG